MPNTVHEGSAGDSVCLGYRKTFDAVPHGILREKLWERGLDEPRGAALNRGGMAEPRARHSAASNDQCTLGLVLGPVPSNIAIRDLEARQSTFSTVTDGTEWGEVTSPGGSCCSVVRRNPGWAAEMGGRSLGRVSTGQCWVLTWEEQPEDGPGAAGREAAPQKRLRGSWETPS